MPSFAESLEATLHNALKHAGDRAHEYATLEHLLLALIDDADAAKVMQACGVDLGELSDIIITYLDTELESLRVEGKVDPSPTSGFQRVVQRAILHVQSSGKDVVTGANLQGFILIQPIDIGDGEAGDAVDHAGEAEHNSI